MPSGVFEERLEIEPRHPMAHGECCAGHASLHVQLPDETAPEVLDHLLVYLPLALHALAETLLLVPARAQNMRRKWDQAAPHCLQQVVARWHLREETCRGHRDEPQNPRGVSLRKCHSDRATQAEADQVHRTVTDAKHVKQVIGLIDKEVEVIPAPRSAADAGRRAAAAALAWAQVDPRRVAHPMAIEVEAQHAEVLLRQELACLLEEQPGAIQPMKADDDLCILWPL
mmetsp:Transcript_101912/g.263383  ORF Transcript_101912/g.263383 Transcript_101912/m.263383 type:complete len:228 (+) Transcript_101912:693-1376(+)